MGSNWPGLANKDDPDWRDPRYQRRIVGVTRPFAIVGNVHEIMLECGHEPLMLGGRTPAVGMAVFCGDCRDEAKGERE